MGQNTSTAVMAQRVEAHDSLDDFPTPPWGTRALVERVLTQLIDTSGLVGQTAWEPCCNRGFMARPLREYFRRVVATDIADYGWQGWDGQCDFLFPGSAPRLVQDEGVDWIIGNPPFRLGQEFITRALAVARIGVAIAGRTSGTLT